MARTTRIRSRTLTVGSGKRTLKVGNTAPVDLIRTVTYNASCADSRGRPVVPSPLTVTNSIGGLYANGSWRDAYTVNGQAIISYENYPIEVSSGGLDTTPLAAPGGWTLDLVAGTNPNRPVIVPLMLLQDLITLPGMIRQFGKLITTPKSAMSPKETASYYLGAQFGWLPLFDDINKLLNLQSHIMKKTDELRRLHNGRGLRRRLKFGESNQNTTSYEDQGGYVLGNMRAHFDITVAKRSWATIRWKPTGVLPGYHPGDEVLAAKARQIASGLTLASTLRGAWELIPWTWLLGWFTNIGKYTMAHANTVPVQYQDMCFMSESKRTYIARVPTFTNGTNISASVTGARVVTTKTRSVSSSVSAGFNAPFLDAFRLSILGALFTQRLKRL